jgi:lysophospholipase L1-like esterase
VTRCGCSGSCACHLAPGKGITITGVGTAENPWTVEAVPLTAPPSTNLSLPPYAANKTRPYTWDPELSLYNGTGPTLRALRAVAARSRAGDDVGRITVIGGGTTSGRGTQADLAWPAELRSRLKTLGWSLRSEGIAFAGVPAPDDRWTVHGGTPTDGGLWTALSGAGEGKTFTSELPGTMIDIHYYNDSGLFHYNIDGTGNHPITAPGGNDIGKETIGPLADTVHEVEITVNSTDTAWIVGVEVYDPAGGIAITNAAATTADGAQNWVGTGKRSQFDAATCGVTGLFLILLGHSDSFMGLGAANFRGYLNSIVGNAQLHAPVILMTPWNAAPTSTTLHAPYLTACWDVAETRHVALLDIYDRIGPWTVADDLRLMVDEHNPNRGGHTAIAEAVLGLLR